jgi:hypothetical protein
VLNPRTQFFRSQGFRQSNVLFAPYRVSPL